MYIVTFISEEKSETWRSQGPCLSLYNLNLPELGFPGRTDSTGHAQCWAAQVGQIILVSIASVLGLVFLLFRIGRLMLCARLRAQMLPILLGVPAGSEDTGGSGLLWILVKTEWLKNTQTSILLSLPGLRVHLFPLILLERITVISFHLHFRNAHK
jgi:hypothetical protein